MGYLFLLLALICGTTKGYCGKRTSGFLQKTSDSVYVNLLRMVLCSFIGAVILLPSGFNGFLTSLQVLLISAASGLTLSLFIISWILSVKTGAYMMVDVFLTAGVIIPVTACRFLYGEELSFKHIIGFILLIAAVIVMCSYNKSIKANLTPSAAILLTLCGLSSGATDLLQKVFIHNSSGVTVATFNFYTYIFAMVILAITFSVFCFAGEKSSPNVPMVRVLPYIVVMSLCLFFHSYLKTQAASLLPAIIIYPFSQTGGMILSVIMASVFFREKITLKCVAGITIALFALLIINL